MQHVVRPGRLWLSPSALKPRNYQASVEQLPRARSQAAPVEIANARRRHDPYANGVEVNIVADAREVRAGFNQQGFITPLENVAVLSVKPREPRREGGLQPVHPVHQTGRRRFQRQVVVISHHDVGVDTPTEPSERFVQRAHKRVACAIGDRYVVLEIPAIDDVVERAGKLDAQAPSLAAQCTKYSVRAPAWRHPEKGGGGGDNRCVLAVRTSNSRPSSSRPRLQPLLQTTPSR